MLPLLKLYHSPPLRGQNVGKYESFINKVEIEHDKAKPNLPASQTNWADSEGLQQRNMAA